MLPPQPSPHHQYFVCLPSVSTRHRLFLGFWSTLIWHTHHCRHRRSHQCEPRAPIAMTTTQPRRGDLPGMSRLCNQGNQAPQRRPLPQSPPQPRPPCHDRSQTGVRLPMFIQKNKTSISPSIQAYYITATQPWGCAPMQVEETTTTVTTTTERRQQRDDDEHRWCSGAAK
ncbi:hypothetical protein EDB85DRAFT_1952758 [Lactarius pseudohatsudake]|nr:hypothetical protein EDB85DRAFT_1952758 [Lactarius pseudohatsudake]